MLALAALAVLHFSPVSPPVPNRQPSLAAGNGMVAMTFGSGDSIWFTRSVDNAKTWSPPAKVADAPKLMLGRHRGPRVAIAGRTILVSAIPAAGDLLCWRSTDGGRTWSKPSAINDSSKSAREGLHAMAADAEGHVAAAWLDDRRPGGMRLWGAFSADGGATWSTNSMLYESPSGSICECCHPSLVALGGGGFAVMWRNHVSGNRDMYVMRLHSGKPTAPAAKAGTGAWKLEACPMDGGGIAVRSGQIVTAWRREKEVYLAEGAKPETRIATGQDPALAANDKGAYVAWSTAGGVAAQVPGASGPVSLSKSGGFPVLVALPGGGILAAWEDGGSIGSARLD